MDDTKLKKYFDFICLFELFSCFLLFCIAMPLKYGYDILWPMFPSGMIHGVAFTIYILLAIRVRKIYKWDDEDFLFILMFGFIPFATYLVHKKIKNAAQ